MGRKERAERSGKRSEASAKRGGIRRIAVTWLLLAVVVVAAVSVGLSALLLPDRAPALLSQAKETTSAPASVQDYTGTQQVTVVPTVSASRQILGNATGTVTADMSGSGLNSGSPAMRVNDRAVVALNTASPLYRDLNVNDTGDDVLALNNELNRLGYRASPDSNRYTWYTQQGFKQLMADSGNDSDGSLQLADVLWIPESSVHVANWKGSVGLTVSAGAPLGDVPGTITRLDIKGGQPLDTDRTLTVYGQSATLPAGATGVDDATFCQQVTNTADFQSMLSAAAAGTADLSAGVDGSLTLTQPITVLRVPAAAVFGVSNGQGCVASGGKTVKVSIIGSQLGVSLVSPQDGVDPSSIGTVSLGSSIASLPCS